MAWRKHEHPDAFQKEQECEWNQNVQCSYCAPGAGPSSGTFRRKASRFCSDLSVLPFSHADHLGEPVPGLLGAPLPSLVFSLLMGHYSQLPS